MRKVFKIFLILLAVFVILAVLGYAKFYGITKKQKYDNCIKACEKSLLLESSKQYCDPRCEEITGYTQPKGK